MTDTRIDPTTVRIKRGIALANAGAVELHGDLYIVRGNARTYTVSLERESCDCPDYAKRREPCKHVYAVVYAAAQDSCKRSKTARPKRTRHEANALFGAALRNPRFMASI